MPKPKLPTTIGGCQNLIRELKRKLGDAQFSIAQQRARAEMAEELQRLAQGERDLTKAELDKANDALAQLRRDYKVAWQQLEAERESEQGNPLTLEMEIAGLRKQVADLQSQNNQLQSVGTDLVHEQQHNAQLLKDMAGLRAENTLLKTCLARECLRANQAEITATRLQRDLDM